LVLKIAFIVPFAAPLLDQDANSNNNFGGAEVQQMLLANYLVERKHNVKLLVKASASTRQAKTKDNKIITFSMRFAGGSNAWIPFDIISLFSALNKADADIYLIKVPRVLLSIIGVFCRIKRRKLVFWLTSDRDVNLADIEGIGGHVALRAYSFGLRFPYQIIAQNDYQLEMCHNLRLDAILLSSLVKMDNFTRLKFKSNPPIVLWVGSTDKGKHPEVFLEMAQKLPEIQFKMIAFEKTQARANDLRNLCKLIPNLEYLGSVAYKDMDKHYSKASLFVSTSELEGVPNTFLQSWANGTPVASLSIDPDGIIEKKRLGFCAKGDQILLVNEIKKLINNKEMLIEMGENGRCHVAETHSIETVGPKFIDLFTKILSGKL